MELKKINVKTYVSIGLKTNTLSSLVLYVLTEGK